MAVNGPLALDDSLLDDSVSVSPRSGGSAQSGGPEIFPPKNSTIPTGKSAVPWSPSRLGPDATINPSELGGGMPDWLRILLGTIGGGNPYWRGAIAGAGILQPTPAETGELPLSLSGARPEHPHSTGAMPQPFVQPAHPSTMRYPMWPTPPAPSAAAPVAAPPVSSAAPSAPLPPPRSTVTQPKINPAHVDLGYYRAGVGNARTPVFVPQGQTQAPPIFRGPLATGGTGSPYY